MPSSFHDSIDHRLQELNPLSSSLLRTAVLALLPALTVLAFAAKPAFAQSIPPPTPNFLVDDYVSVPRNDSADIEVLGNDTVPEFASFDFSMPENGSFRSFTSNAVRKLLSFNYTPNLNFVGEDSFDYSVSDRRGLALQATVYITVIGGGLNCPTCLNRHEAAPVNVTIDGDGAHNYHFIGDDGVSTGPVLPPVRRLAKKHLPGSGNVVLFNGTNTLSGAPVIISYLSDEQVVHVHTYYPDRHSGSMKPYIFVIDPDNEVSHWEW
ncbi:MAG: Ig-like domain-containing protein [Caldilineaceae bacterium]|nr:Ig-like domain-containing protein [Caldilineaceae bacterium]MXZ21382.1 hypothetical protein [Caldilineaceae bacterium SB0665_bin_25]